MKKIINNPENLSKDEIQLTTKKVRAIIIDNSNNIFITKYADMYMLPGGKVDNNEKDRDTLIRELNEELGIKFDNEEITPFITFENYIKNYPIVNSDKKENKLNITTYYIIKTDKKFNKDNIKLTEKEKQNNFSVISMNLDNIINIVSNYQSKNIRNLPFKTELIKILEEYNKEFIISNNENKKLIDLHSHTTYSDGNLTPDELIKLAIKNNVGTLAITDHDSIKAFDNITLKEELNDIKIIKGIEFSAKSKTGSLHILGYDIDTQNKELLNKVEELKNYSINALLSIIEQLKKDHNIYFTYEEIKELINADRKVGRPDIAKLLIANGYVNSVPEAFDKYLSDAFEKTNDVRKHIYFEECIDIILKSNGIPVLAHPKSLKLNDKELLILIKKMVKSGLMGIEVYHSTHTEEERKKYLEIAKELNLLVSGGSDYHGPITKPDIDLGTGKNNNLKIKNLSILEKIKTH